MAAPDPATDPPLRSDPACGFFEATFEVMGHLAKADGRVSEAEIAVAHSVMDRMDLSSAQRREAIALFNRGKAPDFDLAARLGALRRACGGRLVSTHLFIELQLMAAYADGAPTPEQRRILEAIRNGLGVKAFVYRQLESLLLLQRQMHSGAGRGGAQGPGRGASRSPAEDTRLRRAYATLGVGPASSDAEVKKAYRRLMSQHHPDKLIAQGLPEEALRLASQQTQEIRQAYERVSAARAGRTRAGAGSSRPAGDP